MQNFVLRPKVSKSCDRRKISAAVKKYRDSIGILTPTNSMSVWSTEVYLLSHLSLSLFPQTTDTPCHESVQSLAADPTMIALLKGSLFTDSLENMKISSYGLILCQTNSTHLLLQTTWVFVLNISRLMYQWNDGALIWSLHDLRLCFTIFLKPLIQRPSIQWLLAITTMFLRWPLCQTMMKQIYQATERMTY